MPEIRGVHEVAIRVKNLAAAETFYREVVEQLGPYVPRAAKLPEPETPPERVGLTKPSAPSSEANDATDDPTMPPSPHETAS